ncbi:histone H4 transcription factor [Scaptodrosophila lebanonensis]|uniref:Histone H4 transcription factor n=1 Tax=Drosophila lebanonensis TaxID=7225 RepID=A0A6J2U3K6_DROLE|nr:histone H4 transcription factor [Scaptodrosophila lebanonensis]
MGPESAKKRKSSYILLPCGWGSCQESFENELKLNDHLTEHINGLPQRKWDVDEEDDSKLICIWRGCDFKTVCDEEIARHIYYHGYYSNLLLRGKWECEMSPEIPTCCAPARNGEKLPELNGNFHCGWTDCNRSFVSVVEFQDHIEQHASFEYEIQKSPDDQRPKTQCNWSMCHKKLDNKYRLIEHISTHSNKKQMACYHCGELFRTKTTLFDHLRRQPDNNTHKYQCGQCFKFFATEKLLRSHVLRHVNCHKCTMCDMTCSSSSALTTHIRYRHLKDKPFKCGLCDTRCVRQSDLAKHEQIVHAKTGHNCVQPGCQYSVRTYNQMRRHILEVHGQNPIFYACHCCERYFKVGKSLSMHLISKHGFQLPSGHKRFTYRIDDKGFYRLETMRIESLEVTQQILAPQLKPPDEIDAQPPMGSCYEIVNPTNVEHERVIVSNDANEAEYLGEVVISLPSLEEEE